MFLLERRSVRMRYLCLSTPSSERVSVMTKIGSLAPGQRLVLFSYTQHGHSRNSGTQEVSTLSGSAGVVLTPPFTSVATRVLPLPVLTCASINTPIMPAQSIALLLASIAVKLFSWHSRGKFLIARLFLSR